MFFKLMYTRALQVLVYEQAQTRGLGWSRESGILTGFPGRQGCRPTDCTVSHKGRDDPCALPLCGCECRTGCSLPSCPLFKRASRLKVRTEGEAHPGWGAGACSFPSNTSWEKSTPLDEGLLAATAPRGQYL